MSLRTETMHLDTRTMMGNLKRLNIVIMPAKIKVGLTVAGNRFMIDSILQEPTVPIRRKPYGSWGAVVWTASERKAGELRASGALFVDGVKKRDTRHYGEMATGKYQPTLYGGTPILLMSHEACVVFNAPYAAEQHNKWPEKTQEGAGMLFMSEKLYGNGVEYLAIVARAIRL